jgi:hypothetical protein
MAAGATSLGTGASYTFAGFVADITNISIDGPEAGAVDAAHLGLAQFALRPKLATDLLEPGTITMEGHMKTSIDVDAVVGTSGALAITTGRGAGNSWSYGNAIMTSFSANIPLEDVMTFTATWQINGALTVGA